MDALKAQLEAAQKPAPAAAPAAAPEATPAPAPAPAPIYDDAETTTLAKYREEWPDVAAGEALARRAEYAQLVDHIFGQLRPILANLQTQTETLSTTTQYDTLVKLVPDYDAVRDSVLDWVDKQPDYLQDAYRNVTENGTPQQVADLIGRWRKETGTAAPTPTPTPTPAPAPAAAAAPAAAPAAAALPAAAASLAPVNTGRTTPTGGPDMNDFDGAFKEFANAK